jgi:hypothetical protein
VRQHRLGFALEVDVGGAADVDRGPVIERDRRVLPGLGEPQVAQLPDLVRELGNQVVQFGAVAPRARRTITRRG